jgi:hypothetical protein
MQSLLPYFVLFALAIGTGFALGGSLREFEHLRLHRWGLALIAVALQAPAMAIAGVPASVIGPVMLALSYALVVAFLFANRWIPGARVITIGLLLNLTVVVSNGGMPVQATAIERSGGDPGVLAQARDEKHHLMDGGDVLTPIADVIWLPAPASIVISIGDVLLYGGIAYSLVQIMRGRRRENPRPLALWFPEYRGKHAPEHWRMPIRYRTPDRAEAGRSGTEP